MWLGGEIMANLKNAKKRISVNIKKEARNNGYSASAKTAVKNTAKAAGAVAKKVAGKVAMKVMAFIVANPWILAIMSILLVRKQLLKIL